MSSYFWDIYHINGQENTKSLGTIRTICLVSYKIVTRVRIKKC